MSFAELLIAYLKVRPARPRQTLIEIVGHAYKELVWSRLLAHFLDHRKGHGMSPLFLHALTHKAGHYDPMEVVEDVDLEVKTESGKYIDIMVTTNKKIITIENKVNTVDNNDFDEYQYETRRRAENVGLENLLILLSLYPLEQRRSGFINVTWKSLQQEIRAKSGFLFTAPVEQQTLYFQEFMSMVSNVINERDVDESFFEFVLTHERQIKDLFSNVENLKKYLGKRSDDFEQAIRNVRAGREAYPKQWRETSVDEKTPLLAGAVTFFDLATASGDTIAINVIFEPRGSRVEIFCRGRGDITKYLSRFKAASISLRGLSNSRRFEWDKIFDRLTDAKDMAIEVSSLIDTIQLHILPPSDPSPLIG